MTEPVSLALHRMKLSADRATKAARLANLVDMAYTASQTGDALSEFKYREEAKALYEELNATSH